MTVTISEHDGVRNLHLGTPWVQGSMRISRPYDIELEYVQQMMMWLLFNHRPRHILQLGLGAGSLTKFCYRHFPDAHVSAVELNPDVIRACELMFALPPNDARLNVITMNALEFVKNRANHGSFDVLQVDLYNADARRPALESREFYQACADSLTADGIMTVNLLGSTDTQDENLQAMEPGFGAVAWLPETHDANIVAIAFKSAPQVDFSALYERAEEVRLATGLPAQDWVSGLEVWMLDD
jgi:spermidine synthase